MTSVVTDVLSSAGVLSKEDIPSKVESLRRKIEDVKLEIQESLKNRYVDFIPQFARLDKLASNLDSVKSEYESLYHHVENEIKPQMSNSVSEYHELFNDLKKVNAVKQAVSHLVDMYRSLDAAKNALDQKTYALATHNILKFEQKATEIGLEDEKDIDIFCALKTEFFITKENVIYHLQEEWRQVITFNKANSKICDRKTELTIQLAQRDKFSEVIQCLEQLGHLKPVVRSFGKQFLQLLCEPLISKNAKILLKSTADETVIIASVDDGKPLQADVVLSKLSDMFSALSSSCFSLSVQRAHENVHSLMNVLGSLVDSEFCALIVDKCLKPAVPSQSQDIETFQSCIHSATNFHNTLQELGFLTTKENPLLAFILNVDDLPANKMAVNLLSQARKLMKQDLHQTITVGSSYSVPSDLGVTGKTEELSQMTQTKKGLSRESFTFPLCQISVFAQNLVKLLHQVMKEAKALEKQSHLYSLKLYYTARSICELYCCVVPTFHKDQIMNIPQQTAIHHNNCMYIAHCLLTLGQAHHTLHLSLPVTFADLVPEVRRIGTEAFLAQMRTQRQHILQCLQDPEAFQSATEGDSLTNKAEKTVRQCLCQLELLKRLWSDILPLKVYYKAIGTLLNTFLEEIILHVCSMEDIAAQAAAQLDSVFGIILKQSPELFKVERGDQRDMVHKHVRRWFKFQELQLVLGATLIEIVDRWASGKGPLASHFTADEVKHLIRALFQNTKRRAAALAKIR